jgi:uncharacterized membrane protein
VNDERHSSAASAASAAGEVQTRVNNRIIGFSDGVFAITITLLVLTIDVPSNLTSDEVNGFLWEALPQVVIYAASFMVIGTFWVRHHRMFDMCRAVDGRILILNLVFLGFVSLLPFPSDLLYFDDQSTSAVIAFSTVAGAATLCEVGLWRHLRRHRELLLPDISEERIASLTAWRFWSLGVFIISILVSLFFPRIAVLMLLALLPLYELVYHRHYHRHDRTLYLLRDDQ